jgi:hypothetical protein
MDTMQAVLAEMEASVAKVQEHLHKADSKEARAVRAEVRAADKEFRPPDGAGYKAAALDFAIQVEKQEKIKKEKKTCAGMCKKGTPCQYKAKANGYCKLVCAGMCKKGTPCQYKAKANGYCKLHFQQQSAPPECVEIVSPDEKNAFTKHITGIKNRDKPNDVFLTPLPLAKLAIDMVDVDEADVWFDPFKNTGNFYDQFPTENKVWAELLDGRDFFDFNDKVDVICSNPPFSILDKVFEHAIELNPRVITFVLGFMNLTPKRCHKMQVHGYEITKLHICTVNGWFMSTIVVCFERDKEGVVTHDKKAYNRPKDCPSNQKNK